MIKPQFYTLEVAIAEKLSTEEAFKEGFASGVEHERKRAYSAKLKRSMVKPTRWQILKLKVSQRFAR